MPPSVVAQVGRDREEAVLVAAVVLAGTRARPRKDAVYRENIVLVREIGAGNGADKDGRAVVCPRAVVRAADRRMAYAESEGMEGDAGAIKSL